MLVTYLRTRHAPYTVLLAPRVVNTRAAPRHSQAADVTARRSVRAWYAGERGSLVTRVTLAMMLSDGLPGPMKYSRPNRPATQNTPLLLSDVVILRRVRDGQSIAQAARETGGNYSTITNRMHYLRIRFGVRTTWDLAHHPIVAAQLEEASD